jgi:hypothetical protein
VRALRGSVMSAHPVNRWTVLAVLAKRPKFSMSATNAAYQAALDDGPRALDDGANSDRARIALGWLLRERLVTVSGPIGARQWRITPAGRRELARRAKANP